MTYLQLQVEHRKWLTENYPHQVPLEPAMGIVEEIGEFVQAVLKKQQNSADPRYAGVDWDAAMIDAIGDVAIFCCSLCNSLDLDLTVIVELFDEREKPKKLSEFVYIAADILDAVYDRDLSSVVSGVGDLIDMLRAYSPVPFDEAVFSTWEIVKQRRSNNDL